ncbi:isochorismatase family protein, partial [bacterium 1XD42-8]
SGIGADEFYDGDFWKVPLLLASDISYKDTDKVIYDGEGYEIVKSYLKEKGIENILLCGYATDVCVVSTTAGYENLEKDFNVFVVGDCTLATFPAVKSAGEFTSVALCKASISHFITETAWIQKLK